jgi:hypothetical protein
MQFLEYLIHALHKIHGIVIEKFQFRDFAYRVLDPRSEQRTNLLVILLHQAKCFLGVFLIQKGQVYLHITEVRRHPHCSDTDKLLPQQALSLPLKNLTQILLYLPREFCLPLTFHDAKVTGEEGNWLTG